MGFVSRFRRLSAFDKVACVLAVALFTLWGGAKPGGDRDAPLGDNFGSASDGPNRSVETLSPTDFFAGSNLLSIASFGIGATNQTLYFETIWHSNLFDYADSRFLHLLMSTNLLESRWTPLGLFQMPVGTNRHALALSPSDFDADTLPLYLDSLAGRGFYRFGIDYDADRDGLADALEHLWSFTDPTLKDTDDDGLADSEEMVGGSNPLARDTDGDGLVDGSDPDPLAITPLDDLDGDGIPDAYENHWLGGTNVCDSLGAFAPNGFNVGFTLASGMNPTNGAEGAFLAADNIVAWKICDDFSSHSGGFVTNLYERTFIINRRGNWEQFFISSKPDRAAGWRLDGMMLELEEPESGCGCTNASPNGDSLHVMLSDYAWSLTVRLRQTDESVSSTVPLYLLAYSPSVSIDGATVIHTQSADWNYIDLYGPAMLSYSVEHLGRPCNAPLYPDEEYPLVPSDESMLEFHDNGTLAVGGAGVFRLPSIGLANYLDSPRSPSGPGSLPTPDKQSLLAVLDPSISYGTGHGPNGRGIAFDATWGSYSESDEYPLDSECLWRAWHSDSTGGYVCDCQPEIHVAVDLEDYPDITTNIVVEGETATGAIFIGGVQIWQDSATHYATQGGYAGGASLLSDDDCGECASCEDGDCDGLEGDDLGSVKFRIPLGVPRRGQVSGFAWFKLAWPSNIGFSTLQIAKRTDAQVADTTSGGVRTVVCGDNRGRTLAISQIAGGIEVVVTDTASGALQHTWQITNVGGSPSRIRLRKISRANNVMSDRTYTYANGDWTRFDNISQSAEETTTLGDLDVEGVKREERVVRDVSGAVLSHTVSVSERIGAFSSAVLRQSCFAEESFSNIWHASFASYYCEETNSLRHGNVRLEWGNCRNWRFTAYDAIGRTILTLDQYNGSECPTNALLAVEADAFDDASPLEWLQTLDVSAIATLFDYTPLAGDGNSSADTMKPRTESRYLVADGTATLIGRTWTRYTHGAAGGYATITVETIRAGAQDAALGDSRNAVSIETRYDEDAAGTPLALRGAPVSATDEDGLTTSWEYAISDGVLTTTELKSKGGVEAPVASVSQRCTTYGNLLREWGVHVDSGTPFDEREHLYDDKNRLISTRYADGSFTTNAYSCCRLLWSQGRDGFKTVRSAVTGEDHLYYANLDVSFGDLPVYDRFGPYSDPSRWTSQDYHSFRVTQHFMDAIGRETNTVVGAIRREDAHNPSSRTFSNVNPYAWRSSAVASHPYGTSDYSVVNDQRGNATTTIRTSTSESDIAQTITPHKTTTTTTYRNGDSMMREECGAPGSAGVSPAENSWRVTRSCRNYLADGTVIAHTVVTSSDGDCVTNSMTQSDFLGRAIRSITPLSDAAYAYDGTSSRVTSTLDTISGIAVTNLYDDLGEQIGQVQAGVETRTETIYDVVSNILWRTILEHWLPACDATLPGQTPPPTNSSTPPLLHSSTSTRTRLTGLSNALRSESETRIDGVLQSRHISSFNPGNFVLTETAIYATSGTNVTKRLFGRVTETTDSAGIVRHYYDPYGNRYFSDRRPAGSSEWRRIELVERNVVGDIVCEDIFHGRGLNHVSICHAYDTFGNRIATTNALGGVTHYAYDAANRLVATGGAVYPVLYGYDAHGRRTTLSTTRDNSSTLQPFNFSTWSSSIPWDTTEWNYDAAPGLCTNKTYADGSSVSYTYTPDGKPLRTTYPDGNWSENAYDTNRRLSSVEYSDGEVDHFTYDALGRTISESNSVASVTYLRDARGNCTNETSITATQTNTIDRIFDPYGRLASTTFHSPLSTFHSYSYAPDGRIASISNAEAVVEYHYTSDRQDAGYTLTLTNGTVFTRTVVRDAYRRSLITAITNFVNGVPVETFSYTYDGLGRPITRNADAFGYNDRSEVVFSRRAAEGAEDEYAYDSIGNLLTCASPSCTNLYSANSLNQYASISNLCASAPLRELSYDLNGNLTTNIFHSPFSILHSYSYDTANRLSSVSSNGAVVATFAYDAKGRRVRKTISRGGTETQRVDYIWDGWLLVGETVSNNDYPLATIDYHWGKDLSGNLHGAGGIGGLLYLTVSNSSTYQLYVPFYDSNGNITRYCDAQGNVVASYTYDAFGNTVAQSGAMADEFAFRFSTKYCNIETELYYYGYRYYSPSLMRWLNRDPIEEHGGLNLYAFCGNNGVSYFDGIGLWAITIISSMTTSDDEAVWRKYDKNSVIVSGVGSLEEMMLILETQVAQHGGEKITKLNISGHGLAGGIGVQFSIIPHFDLSELDFGMKQRLTAVLGQDAQIVLWSCDSARTKKQCEKLQNAANELSLTILAKNSEVGAGPDIGTGLDDFFSHIVAFFYKDIEANDWKRFTPVQGKSAKRDGPDAKLLEVQRTK